MTGSVISSPLCLWASPSSPSPSSSLFSRFPFLRFVAMVNGPGLYSDIGKRARGTLLSPFLSILFFFKIIFIFFIKNISLNYRSSVQGLSQRPEILHHHLLSQWNCQFSFFLHSSTYIKYISAFFLILFLSSYEV